ncbi:MAG TPA: polysaccharide deacetylase family protein [Thermoanaerobaculia bacterium]|nr:polysaccharide deacetylase family protein [Thermoanaerobaculia bacterium]
MAARAFLATIFVLLTSFPALAHKKADPRDHSGAIVLCYHIVESPQDPRMEISRETFRQQMEYLEMTGYNVIPLRHLYEYVTGERDSLPPNAVVITIDDGWRSTYTEAYPELKKRGFPFTVFVYPNIISKTIISLNWDQIREMSENGGDIESHSWSHPFLTRRRHEELDDAGYATWLQRELVESKRLIEKHTGETVEFLAYPYGDYDHRLKAAVAKAGYAAALTCEFGKVIQGSDPLRMKRLVIDKRIDFAEFRHYMGATPMQLAEMSPKPGDVTEPAMTISARIPNFKNLDPHSVGMALLGAGSLLPYAYDEQTGAITLVLNDAIKSITGTYQRAVVWATDTKTGRRVEASWTFKWPDQVLPPALPVPTTPAQVVPAPSETAAPARRAATAQVIPVSGASAAIVSHPR